MRHNLAYGFDAPRNVDPSEPVLRPRHPQSHPGDVGSSPDVVPVEWVDARRVHTQKDVAITNGRLIDLLEPQGLGRTVPVLNDGLHL